MRQHPAGFQAIFVGIVWPPIMWLTSSWTGFPHPREPIALLILWLFTGALMGGITYGISRLLGVKPRPPAT